MSTEHLLTLRQLFGQGLRRLFQPSRLKARLAEMPLGYEQPTFPFK
jgi:hypothetical protein